MRTQWLKPTLSLGLVSVFSLALVACAGFKAEVLEKKGVTVTNTPPVGGNSYTSVARYNLHILQSAPLIEMMQILAPDVVNPIVNNPNPGALQMTGKIDFDLKNLTTNFGQDQGDGSEIILEGFLSNGDAQGATLVMRSNSAQFSTTEIGNSVMLNGTFFFTEALINNLQVAVQGSLDWQIGQVLYTGEVMMSSAGSAFNSIGTFSIPLCEISKERFQIGGQEIDCRPF